MIQVQEGRFSKAMSKVYLRKFTKNDITKKYLAWLNDKETSKYSNRRFYKTTKKDAFKYFKGFGKDEAFLAIIEKETKKHIGNITITKTNRYSNIAEIAILIGDKSSWGKGFGKEAWLLATDYAFYVLKVRKLTAGTLNPVMEKILKKQKWVLEGVLRKDFQIKKGVYLNKPVFGLLKKEYDSIRKTNNQ